MHRHGCRCRRWSRGPATVDGQSCVEHACLEVTVYGGARRQIPAPWIQSAPRWPVWRDVIYSRSTFKIKTLTKHKQTVRKQQKQLAQLQNTIIVMYGANVIEYFIIRQQLAYCNVCNMCGLVTSLIRRDQESASTAEWLQYGTYLHCWTAERPGLQYWSACLSRVGRSYGMVWD